MNLVPIETTDAAQLGLTLAAHLINRPPEERQAFFTALATGLKSPWQKVERIAPPVRNRKREKCQCQITQYRLDHRAPEFFACRKYATWKINDNLMCGDHANALVWERVLQENGYDAHSDGILIQDGLRPSKGRQEPSS